MDDVQIEITREELRLIQGWLEDAATGSAREHRGLDDAAARQAAEGLADYVEQEGRRGADVVVACGGVKVLCEVILEAEAQRMLEALMAAVAGALPARKVRGGWSCFYPIP